MSDVPDGDRAPACPKCDAPMVRRVAKRGKNVGNEFWGCSTFPKCRSIVAIDNPADGNSAKGVKDDHVCPFSSLPPDPPKGLLRKAFAAVDGVWRWNLELDEPDARDRWRPDHRRKVLNYLDIRDGGRCGLCGGNMRLKGAHVEHVVPKRFAVFELSEAARFCGFGCSGAGVGGHVTRMPRAA